MGLLWGSVRVVCWSVGFLLSGFVASFRQMRMVCGIVHIRRGRLGKAGWRWGIGGGGGMGSLG